MRKTSSIKSRVSNRSIYDDIKNKEQNKESNKLSESPPKNKKNYNEIELIEKLERNLYNINDQYIALTDLNYSLSNTNEMKRNKIRDQQKRFIDMQNKLKERQIFIVSRVDEYKEVNDKYEETKKQNLNLKNEISSIQKAINEICDELEKTSNDIDNDDYESSFEAFHLTKHSVDYMTSSIGKMKEKLINESEKNKEYLEALEKGEIEEKETTSQKEQIFQELQDILEKRSNLMLSFAAPLPDLRNEEIYVESLENDVEKLNSLIATINEKTIYEEVHKSQSEFQKLNKSLTPRKRSLEKKKRRIQGNKNTYLVQKKKKELHSKIDLSPVRNFPFEDELHEATQVVVEIFDKLYHRKRNADLLNYDIKKETQKIACLKAKGEQNLKQKLTNLQILTNKMNEVQKIQIDVSMYEGNMFELRDELASIEERINRVNKSIQKNDENVVYIESKREEIKQKNEELNEQEKLIQQKKTELDEKSKSIKQNETELKEYEKQIEEKEGNVIQLEEESKKLGDQLAALMENFEKDLLKF